MGIFRWASGDTSKDMPFAAQQATDTERNFGPFKRFCHEEVNTTRNGSCTSPVFQIIPLSGDDLLLDVEGYDVLVDVSTEDTYDNATACKKAMGAMAVYTAPADAEEDEGVREGKCAYGESSEPGCFCAITVNHFTTYAVVEETPTVAKAEEDYYFFECPMFTTDPDCNQIPLIILAVGSAVVFVIAVYC